MLQTLGVLQYCKKLVVRLVCAAKRSANTSTLFKQLRIFKCEDLGRFNTAIIMYKAYHNVLPNSLQNMFKLYLSTHGTRHKYTIISHRVPINIKSVCIYVCGVTLWQWLHENITSCCIYALVNKYTYNKTLYFVGTVYISY